MALPFVFFDVGGTLLHFQPTFVDVINEACEDLGLRVDRASASNAIGRAMEVAGRGPDPVDVNLGRAWWYTFFGAFVREVGYLNQSAKLVEELWKRHQSGDWLTPAPDTRSTLESLARDGYRLGVISNWDRTLEAILTRRRLLEFFEVIVASADVGVAKPHPGIFSYAMARARVSPPLVVHIGDDPVADVDGAIGVGIVPVFLGDPHALDGKNSVSRISTLGMLPQVLAGERFY